MKTLYGLKQSEHKWNTELNKQLKAKDFKPLYSDPCAYIHKMKGGTEIITVWVENLLIFTSDKKLMDELKQELQNMFKTTDLGELHKIVGIEITRDHENGTLMISQTKYIESILAKHRLLDANSVGMPLDPSMKLEPTIKSADKGDRSNNYASLIGSLMYAAVVTRPDIAYAVYRLTSYMTNPDMTHWTAAKQILRYLKGTKDLGITYKVNVLRDDKEHFVRYSDASFANNNDKTSVSGYVFLLSGGAITWGSKKQNTVSLSMTEAEYICLSDAAREATWLRNLHKELGYEQNGPTLIYGDNISALAIAQNLQYHKQMKHFDIKHHYIQSQVHKKQISVVYKPTAQMMADIFTKALPKPSHERHRTQLGM